MRDTILIAGDSWGVGEWDEIGENRIFWQEAVSHPGLQHYLCENGQKVINLSRPGGSNSDSWHSCVTFLTNNPQLKNTIRYILVFHTEWQRDLCQTWHIHEASDYSFEDLQARWTGRMYVKLSELSVMTDIPIYLIGGAGDTIWAQNFGDHYPGVDIVCQSMTNLLINDNHRIDEPIMISVFARILEQMALIKSKNFDAADKIFMMKEIEKSNQRLQTWQKNPAWFQPDDLHANRYAHKKLFEFLCDRIPSFLT